MPNRIRLNKLIADSGLASRRQADRMIEDGEITINGKRTFELGVRVDPETDQIRVKGKPLPRPTRKLYFVINKPKGVLTSTSDPQGRPVINDLFSSIPARLFPVGRLDWDSEGLLLVTNDGDFANKVMHPKAEVTKTYLAKVNGDVSEEKMGKLRRGVTIVGGRVRALELEKVKKQVKGKYTWVRITIAEGKNRQIRKMFEKVNCDVMKLQRIAIGRLRLGTLKKGHYRELTANQMEKIFQTELQPAASSKKKTRSRKSETPKRKTQRSVKKDSARNSKKTPTRRKKKTSQRGS